MTALLKTLKKWLKIDNTPASSTILPPLSAAEKKKITKRENYLKAVKAAEEDPKNARFVFSTKSMFASSGLLDVDQLYPEATELYQLNDRLRAFTEEWKVLMNNDFVPIEMRLVEVARVLEVFQRRSTMTAGFVRDTIQDLANDLYYRLFCDAKILRDNYVMSLTATQLLRNNFHSKEVAKHLASIVQDPELDEQTRMEMADNLELNCGYKEYKEIGTEYINSVIGENNHRSWRSNMPIKNFDNG